MKILNGSFVRRLFTLFVIAFLLLFTTSNTRSMQSIEKLAYVVAFGIDVGSNNALKLSIQIAKPSSISSSSSSEQSSSSVVNSVECSSIQEGLNLLNSYISRTVNLSHCKVIAISENIAFKDISEYLQDLANNIEVSTHANIIITKCDASVFLEMTNPTLESFPARYYDIINSASISTAYTKSSTLIDFFSIYNSSFQEPVSVLAGINNSYTHSYDISGSYTNKDNSYIAGQTPIISSNHIENMGLAIFKDNKLVGELNAMESICHMMISGSLKYCNIQVASPDDDTKNIDLRINLNGKSKIKIKLINDSPYIDINIPLVAQIISSNGKTYYSNNNNTERLENKINSYLEEVILNYLYKISKQYNSDIDGFGKYAIKYFLTVDDWNNYNWLNRFQNSFFKVKVNSKVKSTSNFINN